MKHISISEHKAPKAPKIPQDLMVKRIKDLKITLINCQNIAADDEIKNKIVWIEDSDSRKDALADIISFTSKNELNIIYQNYRRLEFWKELYKDNFNVKAFKSEFKEIEKKKKDYTKPYIRFNRWSTIFKKLPPGSYLSCNIPNTYWRLMESKRFKEIIDDW